MTQRHREILKLLAAGGELIRPASAYQRTYRLRMPGDPFYGGQVVRDASVRALLAKGLVDEQLRPTAKAYGKGGLAPATSIR